MKTFLKIVGGIVVVLIVLAVIGSFLPDTDKGKTSKENVASSPTTTQTASSSPEGTATTNSDSDSNSDDHPSMQASVNAQAQLLSITADDDKAFTIQRVVFNGRDKEKGCDLPNYPLDPGAMSNTPFGGLQAVSGTKLPITLKRGDQAAFLSGCGNTVLSVDVHTDRGTSHFTFEEN